MEYRLTIVTEGKMDGAPYVKPLIETRLAVSSSGNVCFQYRVEGETFWSTASYIDTSGAIFSTKHGGHVTARAF